MMPTPASATTSTIRTDMILKRIDSFDMTIFQTKAIDRLRTRHGDSDRLIQ
jgi:hypothetical protein